MKTGPIALTLGLSAVLLAGCPASEPQPAVSPDGADSGAGETARPAPPPTPEAELERALEAWAKTGLRGRPLIPHTKFAALLPDHLAGLTGGESRGQTLQRGVNSVSEVTREYTAPGRTLTIRIMDRPMTGAMEGDAIRLIAMSAEEDELKRTLPYQHGRHHGRIQLFKAEPRARALMVIERFRLEIATGGFDGASGVDQALEGLDLDALAALLEGSRRKPAAVPSLIGPAAPAHPGPAPGD